MRHELLTLGTRLLLVCASVGCSRADSPSVAAAPTATARVVYVVVTPTQGQREAELVWTPEPELAIATTIAAPTAAIPPTPQPTVDIASIPSMDRQMEPSPQVKSRSDQLAGCMTYSAEPDPGGQWYRVRVTGRNSCNAPVTTDESWFEITAFDWNGARAGREVGRFQSMIPARGQAQTYIEVECPKGPCRYSAAAWWAAGGGRKPE